MFLLHCFLELIIHLWLFYFRVIAVKQLIEELKLPATVSILVLETRFKTTVRDLLPSDEVSFIENYKSMTMLFVGLKSNVTKQASGIVTYFDKVYFGRVLCKAAPKSWDQGKIARFWSIQQTNSEKSFKLFSNILAVVKKLDDCPRAWEFLLQINHTRFRSSIRVDVLESKVSSNNHSFFSRVLLFDYSQVFTQLTDDEKYILLRRCYKRESDPNKNNRIVTRKDVKTQEPYVKAVANAITRFNSDLASLREEFNVVAGAPGDFTSKDNTSLLVKLVDGSYDHQFDLAGSASSTRISAISSVYERIRRQFEQAQAKSSELAKEKSSEPPASKNSTNKNEASSGSEDEDDGSSSEGDDSSNGSEGEEGKGDGNDNQSSADKEAARKVARAAARKRALASLAKQEAAKRRKAEQLKKARLTADSGVLEKMKKLALSTSGVSDSELSSSSRYHGGRGNYKKKRPTIANAIAPVDKSTMVERLKMMEIERFDQVHWFTDLVW